MDVQKLAKVLALAASDNEAEAVHALRTAKRLLDAHGADFVELGRRLSEGGGDSGQREALEDAVFDLRNEIRHLRAENERLKQARATAAPAAEPPSLAEAARDAAAAIRLRAELADLRDALEAREAELLHLRAHQAGMAEDRARAGKRVDELEARRMRLEAENRRLSTANNALTAELAELRTNRTAMAAQLLAADTGALLAGKKARRAKAKPGQSQYALF